MKRRHTVILGTKHVVVRKSRRPLTGADGLCHGGNGDIVISCDCAPEDILRVFVHEALHKLFWFLDEAVVHEASSELADALEELELA